MSRLKQIRKAKRITQKTLALAAQVSQPFLHDLENGNRNAKPETWARLAEVLGCTVEDIIGDEASA